MADIQGIDGVVNLFNLSGAKNFAIYDIFKQNKLPLFKAEANTTAELIDKFKEFAKSLSNRNYDIIIVKDDEKIKFTFSNNNINQMQSNTNDTAKLNDVLNEIAELKSKLQERNTQPSIEYSQWIEYKIENKFLKEQNETLKKEIEDLQVYVDELEIQLKTLSDKLQNDDKFLKYYNLFKDKDKANESNKAVVNDNVSNASDNDKKETIKEFLKVVTQNFTINEIKKLTEKLKDKNTINQIKNFLL